MSRWLAQSYRETPCTTVLMIMTLASILAMIVILPLK